MTSGVPDWVIDQYGEEGPRNQSWFIDGVIKHHRTLASILNTATAAGLMIERILEPTPTRELLQRRPDSRSIGRGPHCSSSARDEWKIGQVETNCPGSGGV